MGQARAKFARVTSAWPAGWLAHLVNLYPVASLDILNAINVPVKPVCVCELANLLTLNLDI